MSDILPSRTVISNALNQLSQLAPTSDLAQKGMDVLVKHLAGNVLSLTKSSGLVNKTVLLNTPQIQGRLQPEQNYQIKLSLNAGAPALDFFAATSQVSTTTVSLSEKQLQSLLSLSAKQLQIIQPLSGTPLPAKLPPLSATVLPPVVTSPQATATSQALSVDGKVPAAVSQPSVLRLSLTDVRPPIEVNLPTKQADRLAVGDKVLLNLSPKGVNWQVSITPMTNQTSVQKMDTQISNAITTTKAAMQSTLPSQPNNPRVLSAEPKTIQAEPGKALPQQVLLTPQQASPLIQVSLREPNISKAVVVELPLKAVIQQLNKVNTPQNQALAQTLQSVPIDKLSIQATSSGEANLLLQSNKPLASITINKELANALAPLRLPNQQTITNMVNQQPAETRDISNKVLVSTPSNNALLNEAAKLGQQNSQSQVSAPAMSDKNTLTVNSQANQLLKPASQPQGNSAPNELNTKTDTLAKSADTQMSLKEASAQLLNLIRDTPSVQSVITPTLLSSKTEQTNLLQSLIRIVKAKAEAPAVTLQSIEKALSDPEFFKASSEQSGKQLVEQILQQIKLALPQGKEQDPGQIRQLLTSPTLGLSPIQMVSPASNQGIVGGLITLLQISLSARLSRNDSNRSEQITKVLNDFLGTSNTAVKAPLTPRALNDLSQLEQKHQLMREIGRLLSGHQASKLSNAEQMLQGQETFYYNLPSALAGNIKDIELLIKRDEQNKSEQESENSANQTWQLTMKLSVGELGELLTKAKLTADNLELHFYASNDQVKNQVLNFLPLLRRKLDSLGIEMSKSHCQLGKIPDTLQQRPYHVFQAKA